MAAADFYFGINATFRHIYEEYGEAELINYWRAMGEEYFAPVTERFKGGGLPSVAQYWREFFAEEPGSEVEITEETDCVRVEVKVCPALKHLREHERDIMPLYCQHCTEISRAICEPASIMVRVAGGNGNCCQWFCREGE